MSKRKHNEILETNQSSESNKRQKTNELDLSGQAIEQSLPNAPLNYDADDLLDDLNDLNVFPDLNFNNINANSLNNDFNQYSESNQGDTTINPNFIENNYDNISNQNMIEGGGNASPNPALDVNDLYDNFFDLNLNFNNINANSLNNDFNQYSESNQGDTTINPNFIENNYDNISNQNMGGGGGNASLNPVQYATANGTSTLLHYSLIKRLDKRIGYSNIDIILLLKQDGTRLDTKENGMTCLGLLQQLITKEGKKLKVTTTGHNYTSIGTLLRCYHKITDANNKLNNKLNKFVALLNKAVDFMSFNTENEQDLREAQKQFVNFKIYYHNELSQNILNMNLANISSTTLKAKIDEYIRKNPNASLNSNTTIVDNDHTPIVDNDHTPIVDNDHTPIVDNDHTPIVDNDHTLLRKALQSEKTKNKTVISLLYKGLEPDRESIDMIVKIIDSNATGKEVKYVNFDKFFRIYDLESCPELKSFRKLFHKALDISRWVGTQGIEKAHKQIKDFLQYYREVILKNNIEITQIIKASIRSDVEEYINNLNNNSSSHHEDTHNVVEQNTEDGHTDSSTHHLNVNNNSSVNHANDQNMGGGGGNASPNVSGEHLSTASSGFGNNIGYNNVQQLAKENINHNNQQSINQSVNKNSSNNNVKKTASSNNVNSKKDESYPDILFISILAANKDHQEILNSLFNRYIKNNPNKDLNAQNEEGDTLLHIALKKGYFSTIKLLYDKKLRTDIENKEKKTAMDIAVNILFPQETEKVVEYNQEQQDLLNDLISGNADAHSHPIIIEIKEEEVDNSSNSNQNKNNGNSDNSIYNNNYNSYHPVNNNSSINYASNQNMGGGGGGGNALIKPIQNINPLVANNNNLAPQMLSTNSNYNSYHPVNNNSSVNHAYNQNMVGPWHNVLNPIQNINPLVANNNLAPQMLSTNSNYNSYHFVNNNSSVNYASNQNIVGPWHNVLNPIQNINPLVANNNSLAPQMLSTNSNYNSYHPVNNNFSANIGNNLLLKHTNNQHGIDNNNYNKTTNNNFLLGARQNDENMSSLNNLLNNQANYPNVSKINQSMQNNTSPNSKNNIEFHGKQLINIINEKIINESTQNIDENIESKIYSNLQIFINTVKQQCQNDSYSFSKIINYQDNNGNTALHIAAFKGFIGTCKFLVVLGVDLNIQNNEGNTAVHLASEWGYLQAMISIIPTNIIAFKYLVLNNQKENIFDVDKKECHKYTNLTHNVSDVVTLDHIFKTCQERYVKHSIVNQNHCVTNEFLANTLGSDDNSNNQLSQHDQNLSSGSTEQNDLATPDVNNLLGDTNF